MTTECLICLTPTKIKINKSTSLYSTTTKHYYVQNCKCTMICHPSCMEKWMNVSPNCLICRKPLGVCWSFQRIKTTCIFFCYDRRIHLIIVMAIYLKMMFFIYENTVTTHCKSIPVNNHTDMPHDKYMKTHTTSYVV